MVDFENLEWKLAESLVALPDLGCSGSSAPLCADAQTLVAIEAVVVVVLAVVGDHHRHL